MRERGQRSKLISRGNRNLYRRVARIFSVNIVRAVCTEGHIHPARSIPLCVEYGVLLDLACAEIPFAFLCAILRRIPAGKGNSILSSCRNRRNARVFQKVAHAHSPFRKLVRVGNVDALHVERNLARIDPLGIKLNVQIRRRLILIAVGAFLVQIPPAEQLAGRFFLFLRPCICRSLPTARRSFVGGRKFEALRVCNVFQIGVECYSAVQLLFCLDLDRVAIAGNRKIQRNHSIRRNRLLVIFATHC